MSGQNGVDLSRLVSDLVSGALGGASAGLSSGSKGKQSTGAYGATPNQGGGYQNYQRPNAQRVQNSPLRPPPAPGQTFDTIRPLAQNLRPQLNNRPIREPSSSGTSYNPPNSYGAPAPAPAVSINVVNTEVCDHETHMRISPRRESRT